MRNVEKIDRVITAPYCIVILDSNNQQGKDLRVWAERLYESDPSVCYDIHGLS